MKKNKRYFFFSLLLAALQPCYTQSLRINEFETNNIATWADNYLEFDDWIEIANTADHEIDLNRYGITDDLEERFKFQLLAAGNELKIAAHGFLLLWADDDESQGTMHLSFNISGKGGMIALFSPDGELVDSVNYGLQYRDVSFGRNFKESGTWGYFSKPTPGAANNSYCYKGVLASPVFDHPSGFYNSPVDISIMPAQPGDSVYYTSNNTLPDESSSFVKEPIHISQSSLIQAIESRSGYLSGYPSQSLYLFRQPFNLPVMALITDSFNLFGISGIYTHYDEPWERFCRIEYFSEGLIKSEVNAGLRIQGASSTFMDKKGFRLFFRSDYGTSSYDYPLFGDPNFSSFERIVLKPGYDDDITTEKGTLLRDALTLELWKKCGGLKQLSTWVILYLNNRYWGIYNLRESIDEHFIRAHTGWNDFDLVRLRNEGPEIIYGSDDNWNAMYDLVTKADLADDKNYRELENMLDMDDFINLMALVQCTGYYSWSWGVSAYHAVGNKWRMSVWDADRAFYDASWNAFESMQNDHTGMYWANNFFRSLMKNDDFKKKYSSRLHKLLETVFLPANSISVLDSLYAIIKPEMEGELDRWPAGNINWENNVQDIRDYLMQRPSEIEKQMYNYLPFVTTSQPKVEENPVTTYPNPFESTVYIHLNSFAGERADISIIGLDGSVIKQLYSGRIAKGETTIQWNGESSASGNMPPGIYILRIDAGDRTRFFKIVKK